jgi:hypothetical protein
LKTPQLAAFFILDHIVANNLGTGHQPKPENEKAGLSSGCFVSMRTKVFKTLVGCERRCRHSPSDTHGNCISHYQRIEHTLFHFKQ